MTWIKKCRYNTLALAWCNDSINILDYSCKFWWLHHSVTLVLLLFHLLCFVVIENSCVYDCSIYGIICLSFCVFKYSESLFITFNHTVILAKTCKRLVHHIHFLFKSLLNNNQSCTQSLINLRLKNICSLKKMRFSSNSKVIFIKS